MRPPTARLPAASGPATSSSSTRWSSGPGPVLVTSTGQKLVVKEGRGVGTPDVRLEMGDGPHRVLRAGRPACAYALTVSGWVRTSNPASSATRSRRPRRPRHPTFVADFSGGRTGRVAARRRGSDIAEFPTNQGEAKTRRPRSALYGDWPLARSSRGGKGGRRQSSISKNGRVPWESGTAGPASWQLTW